MNGIDTRKEAQETFENTVREARQVRAEAQRTAQHAFDATCANALHKRDDAVRASGSE